ncbi:MAG: hypothetical protein Q8P57_03690 [Candidatus Pacearchaeota archaeon]|nr:hypothetical protein [Candidatus Pacearchaeota archaeon]
MVHKKAQAWGFDLIIGSSIFIVGVILLYFYSINYVTETNEILSSLNYDGENIADNLLSSGYPENWDSENVINIGISNDNKINQTKLDRFAGIIEDDYPKTKSLLNTRYDYYLNFSNQMTISGEPLEGIGVYPENPENIIKVTRFTIYEDKPITMDVYVWN